MRGLSAVFDLFRGAICFFLGCVAQHFIFDSRIFPKITSFFLHGRRRLFRPHYSTESKKMSRAVIEFCLLNKEGNEMRSTRSLHGNSSKNDVTDQRNFIGEEGKSGWLRRRRRRRRRRRAAWKMGFFFGRKFHRFQRLTAPAMNSVRHCCPLMSRCLFGSHVMPFLPSVVPRRTFFTAVGLFYLRRGMRTSSEYLRLRIPRRTKMLGFDFSLVYFLNFCRNGFRTEITWARFPKETKIQSRVSASKRRRDLPLAQTHTIKKHSK